MPAPGPRARTLLAFVGVALLFGSLNLVLYDGVWDNGWYRDDYIWLKIGKNIAASPANLFSPDPVNTEVVMRQTQRVVFALVYALGGVTPSGYHVASLVLHALVAALVWRLLGIVVSQYSEAPPLIRRLAPLAGALFFSTTFSHSHAVLWASAQASLLVTGVLVMVTSYVLQKRSMPLNRHFVIVVAVGYVLALYSKNTAASFPLLLAFIFWSSRRERTGPLGSYAKLVVGLAVISVVHVVFTKAWLGSIDIVDTLGDRTQGDYLLSWNVPRNLAGAVLGVFVPADLYFSRWTRSIPFELAAIAVVALPLVVTWRLRHRSDVVLGLVWIAVCALPVSLFNYQQYAPDLATVTRYYYLPAVGAAVIVTVLVLRVHEMLGRAGKLVPLFLAALCVWFVHFQYAPLQREVAHLRRWGESRAKLIDNTLTYAKRNYLPGSTIYAHNWFVDEVLVPSISEVYFEEHGFRLEPQTELNQFIAQGTTADRLRYVASFDRDALRLRLRTLRAHVADQAPAQSGSGQ